MAILTILRGCKWCEILNCAGQTAPTATLLANKQLINASALPQRLNWSIFITQSE